MAVSTTPISANYFGMTIESPDYNYSYLGGPVEAWPTIPVGIVTQLGCVVSGQWPDRISRLGRSQSFRGRL